MIYIGIDPDFEKNGVAILTPDGVVDTKNLCFWRTIELLENINKTTRVHVVLEAGWLIKKSNWHNEKQGVRVASKIGKNVGMNHASGQLLEQFLKIKSINYELVKPLGKVNNVFIQKLFKLPKKKTNQEERDALMLVFKYLIK